MWILLSLIAAFSQALGAAIKKKALQTPGMNNIIGFIAFAVAGVIFGIMVYLETGNIFYENLSGRFWHAMFWYAGLNILAVYFLYKALDNAEFNYLMPFMTLTSLSLILPPIFILKEIPSLKSLLGIVLIVIGAINMNKRPKKELLTEAGKKTKGKNRLGAIYFLVTAACFSITPTAAKIAVLESSALFTSFVVHILISLGFLVLIFLTREQKKINEIFKPKMKSFLLGVVFAGMIIVFENGTVNFAFNEASVAHVMAIKRTMPLFAFFIGLVYFKEKEDLKRKILSTIFMVIGAVLVTIYK